LWSVQGRHLLLLPSWRVRPAPLLRRGIPWTRLLRMLLLLRPLATVQIWNAEAAAEGAHQAAQEVLLRRHRACGRCPARKFGAR